MKNPSFWMAPPDVTTKTRLSLRSTDTLVQGEDFPSVCICIYEIIDGSTYRVFMEDDSYAGRPWGFYTPYSQHHLTL